MTEQWARGMSIAAGNRSMAAAGRTAWTDDDCDAAIVEYTRQWREADRIYDTLVAFACVVLVVALGLGTWWGTITAMRFMIGGL